VKKARFDVHWANSPSVNWEYVVEGTRVETRHQRTASLPVSSAEQPVTLEGVTPGEYRLQVYRFTVDDPWGMYPTDSIQERLHGISRSISYDHYSHVSVTI
jgi:hypothetical protein